MVSKPPKTSEPAESIREKLCSAIALLEPNASHNECADRLGNIFHMYLQPNPMQDNDECGSNITPLMVACDKSHHAAMGFLKNQLLWTTSARENAEVKQSGKTRHPTLSIKQIVDVWGHPTEISSFSEGGNSPSHHALMVGFHDGIDVLEQFWRCIAESEANDMPANNTSDYTPLASNEESETCAAESTWEFKTKPIPLTVSARNLPKSSLERYCSLISQPNRNRDTPIMMACVSGQESSLRFILSRIISLALNGPEGSGHCEVEKVWRALQQLFAMENGDKVDPLKLACGHGHVSTVEFLIQSHLLSHCQITSSVKIEDLISSGNDDCNSGIEATGEEDKTTLVMDPLVVVTYSDIECCKSSMKSLDDGMKKIATKNISQVHLEEFKVRRKQMHTCLAMLEAEFDKIAAIAATEILNKTESNQDKICETNASKKRNKKKRGKKKNKQSSTIRRDFSADSKLLEAEDVGRNTSNKSRPQRRDLDIYTSTTPFITLEDGRIISRSQLKSNTLSIEDRVEETSTPETSTPKTLQNILESRYRQQKYQQLTKKSGLSNLGSKLSDSNLIDSETEENSDICTSLDPGSIEAKMESLCLDPSMLLLSPHGMAMGMSPCQLDAIESILKHQLIATNEARLIQDRLLAREGKSSHL